MAAVKQLSARIPGSHSRHGKGWSAIMRFAFFIVLLMARPLFADNTIPIPPPAKPAELVQSTGILTPQMVLTSAQQYSPKILAALEERKLANAALTESYGAFDRRVDGEAFTRPQGFYDGRDAGAKLVQPLVPFNSEIYGGYRVSDGTYPIYEDQRNTTNNGEASIGIKLSLLRNRNIDERRLKVLNALLSLDTAQAEIALQNLRVQEEALLTYWDWVEAGFSYQVYQELLTIANQRQNAFKKRVQNGDLPRIYLTENRQYILQRQANVNSALQKFLQTANKLSLYYRGEDGSPVVPLAGQLPTAFYTVIGDADITDVWMQRRPELRAISAELEQLENNIVYGRNLRLPSADLRADYKDDFGAGKTSRDAAESIIKLDISIPLQQRRADGKILKSQAKIRQLQQKQRLMQDELTTQLENTRITLNLAQEYIDITDEEIDLANAMQNAEQIRINNGDSDYFLLNLRDENVAKAKLKNIAAKTVFQQAQAQIYTLMVDMDSLPLDVVQ